MKQIKQPVAAKSPSHPHLWRVCALWLLLLVAYSNSFHAGLVFDNARAIAADPRIREASLPNVTRILTQDYWYNRDTSGLYRPVTTLSYLVNYAILGNGDRPEGYHAVNLALHCANAGLVYALGILILEDALSALALAALWGLHPLLTESVTNIVGRADLLAAFGTLAALLCYLKSAVATGRRKLVWLAGMAAAQTAGLLSKESAAVLPAIMLLHDWLWPKRAAWRARWPGYAALTLPFAVWLILRAQVHTHMVVDFAENPLINAGFLASRLTALKILGKYLWLSVWPANLTADYSFNAIPMFSWSLEDAQLILLIAFIAAVVFFTWKRKPTLLFFALFFFIAIAPVSNLILVIGSIMAERFVYLPLLGLAGCLIVAIRSLPARYQWTATGLLCLAFGARTYARNFDLSDELSLWTSAANAYPTAARPHNNLGNALARLPGRLPDAVAEYRTALRIEPASAEIHYNLANALFAMQGRLPEAIDEYRTALRNDPAHIKAHINLGNALARTTGGASAAAAEYRAALQLDPANADAHYNLGNLLRTLPGRSADAVAEYRAALATDPTKAEAHYNLATLLATSRDGFAGAVAEFQAVASLEPGNADAHYNLGNLFASVPGKLNDAIAEYRAALAANPGKVEARNNLASALSQIPDRMPEAIAEYQAALRMDPGNAEAHYNLGNAYLGMQGGLEDAIAEYRKAIQIQPAFAEAHFNLGRALSQTPSRIPEAIAEFETVLRIGPDPEARQMLDRLRAMRRSGHMP